MSDHDPEECMATDTEISAMQRAL
ncbi:MAG: hypothetical protein QOH68_889, partial [Nocardioidaceae bacterium]|nr:hypothetical protein [Nocardioidaceae bacterium]